ncbi:hypothetical protein [Streptomyces formicae]
MRTRKISALTMTAVALGLALTACNSDDSSGGSSSTSSASSSSSATSTPGSDTGKEKPSGTKPSGTPAKSDKKCTDQINYAGDPRPNAEINSIGEETGTCPPVEKK